MRTAKKYDLSPNLIRATILVESGGNSNAYRFEKRLNDASYGLGQILSGTARGLGFKGNLQDLYDPDVSIDLIGKYYKRVIEKYGNLPIENLVRAYNTGSPQGQPYPGHLEKFKNYFSELAETAPKEEVKKLTPEELKKITDNWRSEAEAVALRNPQPTPTPTSGWQAWLKRLAPEKETELLSPLPAKSPQPTPQAVAPGGFTPVAPAYTPANAPYTPANFTPAAQPRQVTVQRGQTPGGLAQAYLGDWSRWREIWPGNPRQMPTGATLKIPVPSIAGTA